MNCGEAHPNTLGYEPIRAFIRERLKSVTNQEARAELQCIVTLCDGLEHQAELLNIALAWKPKEAA